MANNMKHYAVIGAPVEHSRSPELYAPMFEKAGVDATFERLRITSDELENLREIVKAHELNGFAVTMPHKKAVLPYLDDASFFAKRTGTVNIVCVENGMLIGHNTDGSGIMSALREAGVESTGRTAIILGSGGAACAAKAALEDDGCVAYTVSRQHAKTGRAYPIEDAIFSFEVASSLISGADIFINATPLGMKDGAVFGDLSFVSLLKPSCTVVDMVYRRDRETSLIKSAKQRSLKTVSGERMLYHQGVLAFKLWTGYSYTE
ncbi:MAG: shikimate dehydrogenase [Clostridia bacterium]|nr:shikimate dehydrogenase [Clostridia bacterium]